MLYKTNDDIWKDSLHFRCQCGADEFLDITHLDEKDWEDFEYEISFVQRPRGFWDKLRWLFRPDYYNKVILLSRKDIKELKNYLSKH